MKMLKKLHLVHVFFTVFLMLLSKCISIETAIRTSYCGNIRFQNDFFPLNQMLLCKAQKLYFRTTIGLFQVSSIDYSTKLVTISHSFRSSTSHFISPTVLSAGFPHDPPQPNSVLLFNCSCQRTTINPAFTSNCSNLHGSSNLYESSFAKGISSCLVIEDVMKVDPDFHPKELNCTHYSRVYKKGSVGENSFDQYELGTRISFDVPGHVPNPCDECIKPDGNCGVGLRCICHPVECKDKVVSVGIILSPFGNMLIYLICFTTVLDFFSKS